MTSKTANGYKSCTPSGCCEARFVQKPWLTEDLDRLFLRDSIRRSAAEWKKEGLREDLLVHRNGRLKDAEALLATPGYVVSADSDERAYLNACIAAQQAREAAVQEEQERRIRDAERIAEEQKRAAAAQKRTARATLVGLAVAVLVASLAIFCLSGCFSKPPHIGVGLRRAASECPLRLE